jgi:hypothetical protein
VHPVEIAILMEALVYVLNENILTRNIDYFTSLDDEKNFEVSLIELVDYKLYIMCVYRSRDIFLNKLENLIRKFHFIYLRSFDP